MTTFPRMVQRPTERNQIVHDDPGKDWAARRKHLAVPFDVLILCQDQRWAESELVYDMGAEYAASFQDKRRIFRLKDGRFATLANRPEVIRGAPLEIDFWNWWTHYQTPGLSDFAQAAEIDKMIKSREVING